jgi:hypothetical protein
MGDVELSIKLLIEMMGQDLAESEDPNGLEEDLLAVFQVSWFYGRASLTSF